MRGEPMTEPLPIAQWLRHTPYRDPRVARAPEQEVETRKGLELAVRVGELMLRCGASTRHVENSVIAVAAVAGLRRLELDMTAQSLLVQCPLPDGPPVTMLRVVRSNSRDYARLTDVHRFVQDLVRNGIDDLEQLDAAHQRLRALQRKARPYPHWMVACGYAGLAASVCALLGGGWFATAVAFISALAVDDVDQRLSRRGLPAFYVAAAGGVIAIVVAWLAFLLAAQDWFGVQMSTSDFAYAVSGGIVALLPGQSITGSVEDGITGYPITSAGRLLGVVLGTAGIIAGVAIGLSITLRLDDVLGLNLTSPKALNIFTAPTEMWFQAICGAIGAVAVAVTLQVYRRHLLPSAIIGGLAAMIAASLHTSWGIGATTGVAVAAIFVGLCARAVGYQMTSPGMILVLPAVTPLLPGLRIFRGMYDMVAGSVVGNATVSPGQATATLLGAVAIALAISSGVVLGDVLGAPFDRSIVPSRRARRR